MNWHPDWIGVGNEFVALHGLRPGATYALRVAAVNTQGRAWSEAAVFHTLTAVHCAETHHWQSLLDEADTHRVCAAEHAALSSATSGDPDARGACSVGWTEYLLAGLAAGGTIVVVLLAVLLDMPWGKRVYLAPEPGAQEMAGRPRPRTPQFYGVGGSAHFDGITDFNDALPPEPPPPDSEPAPLAPSAELPRPALARAHLAASSAPSPAAEHAAGAAAPVAAAGFLGEAADALGGAVNALGHAVSSAAGAAPSVGGAVATPNARAIERWGGDGVSPRVSRDNGELADEAAAREAAASAPGRGGRGTPSDLAVDGDGEEIRT